MAITQVGDPYSYYWIKPNEDGSINIGSGVNINIGSVSAEIDASAFADYTGGSADAQIIVAGSTWYNGSFLPILGHVNPSDPVYTANTARPLNISKIGRLKTDNSLGSLGAAGIAAGSGALTLGTQRMVLADNSPLPAGTNGLGSVYVTMGSMQLEAGTSIIGSVVTTGSVKLEANDTRDIACGSDGLAISTRARSSQAGSVDNDDATTLVARINR